MSYVGPTQAAALEVLNYNLSNFTFWQPYKSNINKTHFKISGKLKEIKEIPMNRLMTELRGVKTPELDPDWTESTFWYIWPIILFVIVIVCFIGYKRLFPLLQKSRRRAFTEPQESFNLPEVTTGDPTDEEAEVKDQTPPTMPSAPLLAAPPTSNNNNRTVLYPPLWG